MRFLKESIKTLSPYFLIAIVIAEYLEFFVFLPLNLGLRNYILGSDFRAFYGAGEMVSHGVFKLYDPNIQLVWQKFFIPELQTLMDLAPFRNPPFYALLFVPLVKLPLEQAYYVFLFFNFLLLAAGLYLVFLLLPKLNFYYKACIILMILSYPPVINVLYLTQSSFFLLLALLLVRFFLLKKKNLAAGLTFSLLFIKLQYLPLVILFFVFKRGFKVLVGLFLGLGIWLIISTLIVGVDGMLQYAHFLFYSLGSWDELSVHPRMMFTLQSLFLNLAKTDSIAAIKGLWYGSVLITLGLFFFSLRKNLSFDSYGFDLQWALFIVVLILTSAYTNVQDLAMLIAAAVSLIRWIYLKHQNLPTKKNLLGLIIGGYLFGYILLLEFVNIFYLYIFFLLVVFVSLMVILERLNKSIKPKNST